MRRLAVGVLSLALLGATAVWWFVERPPAVRLAMPQRGAAVEAIYATGTVEPQRWAALAATEVGRIVAYPAREGLRVAADQLLVQLENEALRAEVEELETRVVFLEKELERSSKLLAQNNVSRQVHDRLVSDLGQARAALRARQQRLSESAILAPFEAIVLRVEGEVGEVVKAGDPLVWVGQPPPYWISAEVDEEDIPRVVRGQRVLIIADAFPERVFEGRVDEITPQGDPVNKQYRVRVLLPADSPLLVGMTAEVNVVVRAEDAALLLPESAIVAGGVFVEEDGKARRRELELGVYGADKVEVLEGLDEHARVIDRPPPGLLDGDPVRVVAP